MREAKKYATGATRDTSTGKYEYARFMDPRVTRTFAAYMDHHRVQVNGVLRDPDNWKKGIDISDYKDSLVRHTMDAWELHDYGSVIRPETGEPVTIEETLCSIMFNAQGWLFEILKAKDAPKPEIAPMCASDCGIGF